MKSLIVAVSLCMMVGLSSCSQPHVTYGSNPKAGHYVHVNGIELYYEIYGKGHPLVLLHGNGGSIEAFRYQIPRFEKHYKVIAVDSRGQGKSTDTEAEMTFTLMASDVAGLLDSLRIDSAYVVGWSDGAIVGLKLAQLFPSRVAKLVAIGANFTVDTTALPEAVLKDLSIPFSALDSATQHRIISQSNFPKEAAMIYDQLRKLDLYHPKFTDEQIKSIQTPTLVMSGDHDLIKIGHTVKLFQLLPHAYLCVVPGAHHSLLQEKPDLANEIIEQFLDARFRDLK